MITKKGREKAYELNRAGLEWDYEKSAEVLDTVSLICRHGVTYTRLHEWLASGHPIFGGDWINANWDKLQAQDERLEARLAELGRELASYVSGGSPVLETHSLYGVSIAVTDRRGVPRTREMVD
jgi:hypothetical protein